MPYSNSHSVTSPPAFGVDVPRQRAGSLPGFVAGPVVTPGSGPGPKTRNVAVVEVGRRRRGRWPHSTAAAKESCDGALSEGEPAGRHRVRTRRPGRA